MASYVLFWVINSVITHTPVFETVPESTTAGYEWTCSEPNDAGVRYIPNITDRSTHKVASTVGSQLNIYPVKELTNECHGRINRIEYCFKV